MTKQSSVSIILSTNVNRLEKHTLDSIVVISRTTLVAYGITRVYSSYDFAKLTIVGRCTVLIIARYAY